MSQQSTPPTASRLEAAALAALDRHWGHKAFRGPQKDVIASALHGNDNLLVMATGAGKSICMQVRSCTALHSHG